MKKIDKKAETEVVFRTRKKVQEQKGYIMSQEEILTQARNIKEYCINHTTNEEQCPFFNGYKTEGMLQIVICELNKGMCSPCNWDV